MFGWASQQFERLSAAVAPPPDDPNGRFVYCLQKNDEDGAMACVPQMDAARSVLNATRGSYAIHLACENSMDRLIRQLLQQPGVDLSFVDSQGNTPLHYACMSTDRNRALTTIKMLVAEMKAPVATKNSMGQTPYDFAALDMVRQFLLPIQLQEETKQCIDNGGVGLPPGIDMGGLRISNPAQPPPPIMPVHPAPAPASMPVQHDYQAPKHDIPQAPTSGQGSDYARTGMSSAHIYRPTDKQQRFVKPDGFHSSSSDVNLQRKYGHVPVTGRSAVPPPPSSGNSGAGYASPAPSGPNPFAGNSNPYTAGRAKARYVAYDARTGTAMPMPPSPAQSLPAYGQPPPAAANVSVFSPGAPSATSADRLTPVAPNERIPAQANQASQPYVLQQPQASAQQQPSSQPPFSQNPGQNEKLQHYEQSHQGQPHYREQQYFGQAPEQQHHYAQGYEQSQEQPQQQPQYRQQQQFAQPQQQPPYGQLQQHQYKGEADREVYDQPVYGYPSEQQQGQPVANYQNTYPQGQQRVAEQSPTAAISPGPSSGGVQFSGPNGAAALFSSPSASQGALNDSTTSSGSVSSPQAKKDIPPAPLSGGYSVAALAANAASATELFSSPSASSGNGHIAGSGGIQTQEHVPPSGASFSGEGKAASASELFASASSTGGTASGYDVVPGLSNDGSGLQNPPPVNDTSINNGSLYTAQSTTTPSGNLQFSGTPASAADMFSAPVPAPHLSPEYSVRPAGVGRLHENATLTAPDLVPGRQLGGLDARAVSTSSSAAEELFSSPSPIAANQTTSQPPSQKFDVASPELPRQPGSPVNSDDMLDEVPLSPDVQQKAVERAALSSDQPPVPADNNSTSNATAPATATGNQGVESLYAAIGMPPPPFSSKR